MMTPQQPPPYYARFFDEKGDLSEPWRRFFLTVGINIQGLVAFVGRVNAGAMGMMDLDQPGDQSWSFPVPGPPGPPGKDAPNIPLGMFLMPPVDTPEDPTTWVMRPPPDFPWHEHKNQFEVGDGNYGGSPANVRMTGDPNIYWHAVAEDRNNAVDGWMGIVFSGGLISFVSQDSGATGSNTSFGKDGMVLFDNARGAGAIAGKAIHVGRNTSGNGASGVFVLTDRNGNGRSLWFDVQGTLRWFTSLPTENPTSSDTAGSVVPAVRAWGYLQAKTAASGTIATFTPGTDQLLRVTARVRVTTATTHNFTVEVAYTDDAGTARTVTMNFFLDAGGALVTAVANGNGAVPYYGIPIHLRAKSGTAVTVRTQVAGTYTTVTYDVEATIEGLSSA